MPRLDGRVNPVTGDDVVELPVDSFEDHARAQVHDRSDTGADLLPGEGAEFLGLLVRGAALEGEVLQEVLEVAAVDMGDQTVPVACQTALRQLAEELAAGTGRRQRVVPDPDDRVGGASGGVVGERAPGSRTSRSACCVPSSVWSWGDVPSWSCPPGPDSWGS